MATFVFKVFTLAIRTASKPLANRFQNYVLAHPTLRPNVLRFAQGIHQLDFAMTRFAEGKPIGTSKRFLARLDDERAMDLAGKVVSEGFVLAVAVGVLAWEYNRNSKKDESKIAREASFKKEISDSFAAYDQRVQSIADQNRAIIAAIQERQDAVERQLNLLQESKQHTNTGWGLGWGLRG